MQFNTFFIAFLAPLVSAIVDIDLALDDDTGPPPLSYISDLYDCPLPCADYANIHNWIPYHSVDRLQRCPFPLLLQFSVAQPLDDPSTDVYIRSCTLGSRTLADVNVTSDQIVTVDNPKKADNILTDDTPPACASSGEPAAQSMKMARSPDSTNSTVTDVTELLQGMKDFFGSFDNCDESIVFAHHNYGVAGLYIGRSLGKATVSAAIDVLTARLAMQSSLPEHTIAEVCSSERASDRILGISIDGTGDLAAVQRAVLRWSQGQCTSNDDLVPVDGLQDVQVSEIGPVVYGALSGSNLTSTSWNATSWNATVPMHSRGLLRKRAECRSVAVSAGDTCGSLKNKCGIPAKDFMSFNSKPNLCSSLQPGDHVCCSSGDAWSPSPPPGQGADGSCAHTQVVSGDSCASLATRCGIDGNSLMKFNSGANFCSNLRPDDYICCGPGLRYSPPKPKKNSDGTCATRLIQNGDTCSGLAKQFNVQVTDIESWNKGKTWAWAGCKNLLLGYNMCLSEGDAPLPPPQQGTQCGPMVPGTTVEKGKGLADYNLCPLNACCSNWGYCGPFPAHCDIHSVPGGGPGSKDPAFQTSCISNCGMDIKQNSGPPSAFQRIGYYETWNLERKCLWMRAKDSNTDGSYTHIHWAFLDIDPKTWQPVITDNLAGKNEWGDFKGLTGVKRIVSFGGWSASTEPANYDIIRSAILNNRDTFATNVAQFVKDNGLDGVDFDWEYPGAPDILVNGKPIGQKGDGVGYLKFLTVMKSKLGSSQTLSISAPASYWYLQNFPIKRMADTVDYIVYMTYDLHGQWDYGNVNAFDSCPSGKCIRSHVNLTETRNTLAIITKAGVPNNKIFVGEASYGRSFHMAQSGCWGPMCEFTGSRTQSDANPGRCTNTGGYLAIAEINEIIQKGQADMNFHDGSSNTDVILYKGDYVAYMTSTTKDTRRNDWKNLNFAGTIDWAVDLQAFSGLDENAAPDRPSSGEGCISGSDLTVNSGDLCEYTCSYGFCPDTLCFCDASGTMADLPAVSSTAEYTSWDAIDVDLIRLCKFACQSGYCPPEICTTPDVDEDTGSDDTDVEGNAEAENNSHCYLYTLPSLRQQALIDCKNYCQKTIDTDQQAGTSTNYVCIGVTEGQSTIPWQASPWGGSMSPGRCECDNWLITQLSDDFIDAMTAIGEIVCVTFMSIIKEFVKIGLAMLPGEGQIVGTAYDMAVTAAQMAKYVYPSDQDPQGAFDWWMSPCGDTSLVPQEAWNFFDAIDTAVDYGTSFDISKKAGKLGLKKGSGRKGDSGNPVKPPKHRDPNPKAKDDGGVCARSTISSRAACKPKPKGNGGNKKKECIRIKATDSTKRMGEAKNTLQKMSCVNKKTVIDRWVVTALDRKAGAVPKEQTKTCSRAHSQACFHYSSAIRNNPAWATLTCPPEAAATAWRMIEPANVPIATAAWSSQHRGDGWKEKRSRNNACDRDEFPPAYLLNAQSPAWVKSGPGGQVVRYLPGGDNKGAGRLWKGACFGSILQQMPDAEFERAVLQQARRAQVLNPAKLGGTEIQMALEVDSYGAFIFDWAHKGNPPANDGLMDNPCWPSAKAASDPGFALLTWDPYYGGKAPPYDYTKPYVKGQNGS